MRASLTVRVALTGRPNPAFLVLFKSKESCQIKIVCYVRSYMRYMKAFCCLTNTAWRKFFTPDRHYLVGRPMAEVHNRIDSRDWSQLSRRISRFFAA